MLRRQFVLGTLALALAGSVTLLAPARSIAAPATPSAFVQGLGDRAVAVLADPQRTTPKVRAEFDRLLHEGFDLPTIGRFVLGRYWNTATPQQQEEYQKLFADMIVNVYTERFNQYAGEKFKVMGERKEGARDSIVTSQIVRPQGEPVNVQWRVRPRDSGLKIIDVIVEGVSMSITQRDDFASVIGNNGGRIEALLDVLRKRAQTAKAG
jgi:phospholipid transport system substrate-binding protein